MWFMDALAQGGGTPAGAAKIISQNLIALREVERPPWMNGKTEKEIIDTVTRCICEAVEASYVVKDYVDEERSKDRDFDEIYSEVQPYLDHVSRPLTGESNDFEEAGLPSFQKNFSPDTQEGRTPTQQAARSAAKKANAPHRNLRNWPAAPFLRE